MVTFAGMRSYTALVVSEDDGLRASVSEWLDDAGLVVMACPGPHTPDMTCVGLAASACPLARGADVVVVDLHPEPGRLVDDTPRAELARFYRSQGCHVIALMDGAAAVAPPGMEGVAVAERLTERSALVDMVRQTLAETPVTREEYG